MIEFVMMVLTIQPNLRRNVLVVLNGDIGANPTSRHETLPLKHQSLT